MISYNGLIALGFTPEEFRLQDDSNGEGVYIAEWNSPQTQPSVSAVEQAEQVYIAEAIAKEEAREAIRASALQKLVDKAGLTVEEVKSFIKIEE
jgi:predicted P-loop ATPase/GTPase